MADLPEPLREGEVMGAYMDFDRTADKAWTNAEYLVRFGQFVSQRTADQLRDYAAAKVAEERENTLPLIQQCCAALAEELAAWDIDPPLAHVKDAHDACETWLAAIRGTEAASRGET